MILHTLGLWFFYRIVMWLKSHAEELKEEGGWKLGLDYSGVEINMMVKL